MRTICAEILLICLKIVSVPHRTRECRGGALTLFPRRGEMGQRGRGTVSTVGCTPQSASTRKLTLSNHCEPGSMPGSLFLYQPCGQLRFLAVLVKPMHDGFDVAVTTAVADGMKTTKKKGCVTGLAMVTQPYLQFLKASTHAITHFCQWFPITGITWPG